MVQPRTGSWSLFYFSLKLYFKWNGGFMNHHSRLIKTWEREWVVPPPKGDESIGVWGISWNLEERQVPVTVSLSSLSLQSTNHLTTSPHLSHVLTLICDMPTHAHVSLFACFLPSIHEIENCKTHYLWKPILSSKGIMPYPTSYLPSPSILVQKDSLIYDHNLDLVWHDFLFLLKTTS